MTEEEQPKRKRIRIRQAQQQTLGKQIPYTTKVIATERTPQDRKDRLRAKLAIIHRMLGR